MNHSTSKRTAKALPQVESTVFIAGIDKKIVKCQAPKHAKTSQLATLQSKKARHSSWVVDT
jgi:hypothetical protein